MAVAAEMLKRVRLKADHGEITTEIKIDRKDVATVAQSGILLALFGARQELAVQAVRVQGVQLEEDPAEPQSKPATPQSKPAEKK